MHSMSVKNLLWSNRLHTNIVVKGWLKNKTKGFDGKKIYSLNDGSTSQNIEVRISEKQRRFSLKLEAPFVVEGKLCRDEELREYYIEAEKLEKVSKNEATFHWYKRSFKTLENFSHFHPNFRAKCPSYAAKLRIRAELKMELFKYFNQKDFVNVETPILTRYLRDAENEIFYLQNAHAPYDQNPVNYTFGHPVYLTTSGQLHLECISSGISKVYSMGPVFSTTSSSGKDLYEFWKLECEEAFLAGREGFETLLLNTESLVKHALKFVHQFCKQDCMLVNKDLQKYIRKIEDEPFPRITYSEAIKLMMENADQFREPIKDGIEFKIKHQQFLIRHFDEFPVFVIDYPYQLMPFNTAAIEDSNLVMGFDLILPETGKLVRGGLRESNYKKLYTKLESYGAEDYYSWFLETHKWGCAPTGGFSLGFERLLHFIFNETNIKNVSAFPRGSNFCEC